MIFFLAHELHRPLHHIANEMSYHEFLTWIAYFESRDTLSAT